MRHELVLMLLMLVMSRWRLTYRRYAVGDNAALRVIVPLDLGSTPIASSHGRADRARA
jgi:hypothetical protein